MAVLIIENIAGRWKLSDISTKENGNESKVGIVALKAFNAIGLMRAYTPMPTEAVAAAMIRLAKSGRHGVEIINSQEILKA